MKCDNSLDNIASSSVRNIKPFAFLALLLFPLLLWNCEDDTQVIVDCTFSVSLIGTAAGDCVSETILNEDYTVFRGSRSYNFDLDEDGMNDVEIIIDDRSFGVAGPARGDIKIVPLQQGFSISSIFLESFYCERYYFGYDGTDTIPFYAYQDGRLCSQYTEEELMEYDTFKVLTFAEDMVDTYQMNDVIDPDTDWSTDTLLLYNEPFQPGEVSNDVAFYILFKQETPEENTRFGWLSMKKDFVYGQYGTFLKYGFMK